MHKIKLTDEEKTLLLRIDFDAPSFIAKYDYDKRMDILNACGILCESLISRNAIPLNRLDFINNKEHNIGKSKSIWSVFSEEIRGKTFKSPCYHPGFLKYLYYFLFGPSLSSQLIDEFAESHHNGSVQSLSRHLVRKYQLTGKTDHNEMYKLCLEFEETRSEAGVARNEVMVVRRALMKKSR